MREKATDDCPLVLQFVPVQYKTHEIREKAVDDYTLMLQFITDQYKTHTLCEKVVDDFPSILRFIPDQYKNQEMCEKAIDDYSLVLQFLPDQYKAQALCNKVLMISHQYWDLFLISINPRGRVKKPLIIVHWCCNLPLITLKSKKCVMLQWGKTLTFWIMSLIDLWRKGN